MKTQLAICWSAFRRSVSSLAALCAVAMTLPWVPLSPQACAADGDLVSVQKRCENCWRAVSPAAQRGQTCPHCGAYWSLERTTRLSIPRSVTGPSRHTRDSFPIKPSFRKTWPHVPHQARGGHHLILDNHTSTDIWIGLRDGATGADLKVAAHGKGYLGLPEGTYRVYVFRHDQPTSLYEASSIKLGGKNVIRSSQTFCIWFDEAEPVDNIDPATGGSAIAAR